MVRGPLPAFLLHLAAFPVALAFVFAAPRAAAQAPGPEAVNGAIERGVDFLLRSQNRDGSFGVDLNERGLAQHDLRDGPCALAVYALLKCGLAPDHPALQRAVAFLLEGEPRHTYAVGMQIHALAALRDRAHAERLGELLGILLELQRHDGWDYPGFDRADLSNTQIAALGLRAAHAAGLALPKGIWADLAEMALRHQEPAVDVPVEGARPKRDAPRMAGFGYEPHWKPSASMTTAGITILGIAAEDPARVDRRLAARIDEARTLALAWLAHHYSIEGNPGGEAGWHHYYLYGLERVGAFCGVERIGAHDWYAEGAAQLLKEQRDDGGWRNDGRAAWPPAPMGIANTCFALLFLRKATLSGEARLRETLYALEGATTPVRLRVDAKATWTLWVTGFAPEVAAGDLLVERVEWWIAGALVETVPVDPTKPWTDQSYAIRHQPSGGGALAVECRVLARGPDGAARELRSEPLEVCCAPNSSSSRGCSSTRATPGGTSSRTRASRSAPRARNRRSSRRATCSTGCRAARGGRGRTTPSPGSSSPPRRACASRRSGSARPPRARACAGSACASSASSCASTTPRPRSWSRSSAIRASRRGSSSRRPRSCARSRCA